MVKSAGRKRSGWPAWGLLGVLLLFLWIGHWHRQSLVKHVFEAAERGDVQTLRRLLSRHEELLDVREPRSDVTPLMRACSSCQVEAARFLLTSGARVNVRGHYGDQPAHGAAAVDCAAILLMLHAYGADMDAMAAGATPMHVAVERRSRRAVAALAQCGADLNAGGYYGGLTPLHLAAQRDDAEMVRLLLSLGADADRVDEDGLWPVQCARSEEVRRLLLAAEYRPGTRGSWGATTLDVGSVTMLHVAVGFDSIDLASRLLAKGADVNAHDKWGVCPVHRVVSVEMARLLLRHGADPTLKTHNGRDAVELVGERHPEVARFLRQYGRRAPRGNHAGPP